MSLVDTKFVFDMQLVNPNQEQNATSGDAYAKEEEAGGFDLEEEYEEEGEEGQAEDGGNEDDEDEFDHPDDDRATVSTRTEDDPVRLAMNAFLTEDEDDEDEEEEILYPQTGRDRTL